MKRQRGRGRPGGGNTGGGGKAQQNANRAFESNGPDGVKIRGHAQHVFEKYQQLARDASSAGDRVLAENYLQHAEHYFRLLRAVQPHRTAAEILGRDSIASGFDIDFEDENGDYQVEMQEAEVSDEQPRQDQRLDQRPEQRQEQLRQDTRQDQRGEGRQDQPRRDRDRNFGRDRDREPRQPGERFQQGDRPQGDRPQGDRPQGDRQDRPERQDRPQGERFQGDRPERPFREDRRDRYENRERYSERPTDPLAIVEPEATPLTQSAPMQEASPVLRSQDGSTSHAPAFLQARSEPASVPAASVDVADEEVRPKPRRGRPPRNLEATKPSGSTDEG